MTERDLTPLESAVRTSIEGVRQLQSDNALLRESLDRASASLAMERTKCEQLGAYLSQCEALRDHYMHRAVELEVALTTASSVITQAIAAGAGGVYAGQRSRGASALAELPADESLTRLAKSLAPREEPLQ